jgi:hypothetical protein
MSYIVAIPSYNRVDILKDYTLNMLKLQNVSPSKIDIFVANNDEYDKYKKEIPKKLYNKLIIGKKGLLNQLNFITDYYPEGKHIVRIDDDIDYIFKKKYKHNPNLSRKKIGEFYFLDLDDFFKRAFALAEKLGLNFWGPNKVSNPFMMTDGYSTDLRLITGNINGTINKKSKPYQYKLSTNDNYTAEDIEKTLNFYIADGGVLRINDVGFKTLPYITTEGGITEDIGGDETRLRKIKAMNKILFKNFKKYITIAPNKKQGEVVKFKRNPD